MRPAGGAGVGFKTSLGLMLTSMWVASGGELFGVCALSVAVTEKENEPACIGVPATVPSLPNVRPGGKVPVGFQV